MSDLEHVLDAAETLFLERGYAGTRLRDVADVVGIKHASLYHYAPGGKDELWTRVLDRTFARHRARLAEAAASAPDLRGQLRAMAAWLLSQPPMNVVALASAGLPSAPQPQAQSMAHRIADGVMSPVADAFRAAQQRGEIGEVSPMLLAGMFTAALNAILPVGTAGVFPVPVEEVANGVIDVLVRGASPQR